MYSKHKHKFRITMKVYTCTERRRTSASLSQARRVTFLCKQWHQCNRGHPGFTNPTLPVFLSSAFLDFAPLSLFFFRPGQPHSGACSSVSYLSHDRTSSFDRQDTWRYQNRRLRTSSTAQYEERIHVHKRCSWGSFVLKDFETARVDSFGSASDKRFTFIRLRAIAQVKLD